MNRKVIVVGGGIVGATSALFLSRRGWSATLIEQATIGSRASSAAAGLLSPPFFLDPDEPQSKQNTQPLLSRKGYDFYPEFLDVLSEYVSVNVGFDVSGMWYLAFTEEEYEEQKTIAREMDKFNRSRTWAERDEVLDELPFLSSRVKGGFLFEEEAQINPSKLMETLSEALRESDVEVRELTRVLNVKLSEDRTVSVNLENRTHEADAALIAAGCWTPQLLDNLPVTLPVEPKKGQMISLEAPRLAGHPPVRRGEYFVLPRGQRVIVGSTVEKAGFDVGTTAGSMQILLNKGCELVPELEDASFCDAWAGLRPYADMKGGPFLGQVEEGVPVYYAAGHYKTGILQGPFTGKVMAQYMSGETPEVVVERYGPDR